MADTPVVPPAPPPPKPDVQPTIPANVAAAPIIGAPPIPRPVFPVKIVPDNPAVFPGYPKMLYHPVYPAVLVADPNSAALLPDAANWKNSQDEAVMSRTYAETQLAKALRDKAAVTAYEDAWAAREKAAKDAG